MTYNPIPKGERMKSEQELREIALDHATRVCIGSPHADVLKTAQSYFEFLSGKTQQPTPSGQAINTAHTRF